MNRKGNYTSFDYTSELAITAFEEYFSKEADAELFNFSSLDANIQSLYETPQLSGYKMIREFSRLSGKPDLSQNCVVEYLDLPDFQAYAASSGEYHFVGLSKILPILIQAMFQELVKKTNPFIELEGEMEKEKTFPSLFEFPSGFGVGSEKLLLNTMPEEKWQKVLSTKLAELAALFCVVHEISHLVRGHTKISEIRGAQTIEEISFSRRKISDAVRQAWELQADRTAIAFLFSYVVNNDNYRNKLLKDLKCDRSKDPKIELMGRVVYSVSLILFLIGQKQEDVKAVGTHPAAITRQTFIMAHTVVLLCSDSVGCNEIEAERVIKKSAQQAERAWNRIGYKFGNYTGSLNDLGSVVKRMDRTDVLCSKYLKKYVWAPILR